jgi:hypothetical protein
MTSVAAVPTVTGVIPAMADILLAAGIELIAGRIGLPAKQPRAKNKYDSAYEQHSQDAQMCPTSGIHMPRTRFELQSYSTIKL